MSLYHTKQRNTLSILRRLADIHWVFLFIICLVSIFGVVMLFSAAGGNLSPWALSHFKKLVLGLAVFFVVTLVPIKSWYNASYIIYALTLMLLLMVELMGTTGMGAKRWIDFGIFQFQPSELMKIALILALSRYFHNLPWSHIGDIRYLIFPIFLVTMPFLLVINQPDLGTAILLFCGGLTVFFAGGVRWWKFLISGGAIAISLPILWQFLHTYQKKRVFTFLDPEQDPLGAGYHIIQSKIALGSGGFFGKGFLQGSQSHLNFLPEKQTDFIFTMISEEFGFIGGVLLIFLYFLIICYGYAIALRCQHFFGKLLAIGITTTFFFYLFINISMVMGLLPIVGVPLPLVSFGGTAMLTLMFGFGLLMSIYIDYNLDLRRR